MKRLFISLAILAGISPFHLDIDGKTVQRGNTADMLFKVDEIIAYVSRFCTLMIGLKPNLICPMTFKKSCPIT